jgi:hypothetical protein
MRPSFNDVYGFGSGYIDGTTAPGVAGVFIPENALVPEGGFLEGPDIDPQVWMFLLIQKAGQTLNEANRNNQPADVRSTITYGSFDAIIDPPGSESVYRRDVWSVIAYQEQQFTPFDPNDV